MAKPATMIDADYTAKDGVGTLTISTDDPAVAGNLRDVFFQVQAAVERGKDFRLSVEVAF